MRKIGWLATLVLIGLAVGGAVSAPSLGAGQAVPRITGAAPGQVPTVRQSEEPGFRLLSFGGRGVKWGAPAMGTPAVIRYSFLTRPAVRPDGKNCRKMRPFPAVLSGGLPISAVMAEFRAAFASWEAVAGLSFVETADSATADLLLGLQAMPRGIAYADVAPRSTGAGGRGSAPPAAICLNPAVNWETGFDGDRRTYDLRYVAAHEAGHILGLDHADGRAGERIMSFRYREIVRVPQEPDIAGARLLYGPPVRGAAAALLLAGSGQTDPQP